MTPLIGQIVKSAAILVGACIVLRRFRWSEYPALLSWMLWEVAMQSATFGFRDLPGILIVVQDGVCAAAICEVIRESRLNLDLGVQIRTLLAVLAGSKILASLPALTAAQSWYLFRSYFLWAAFAALLAITITRWMCPVLERKPTVIYRIGATVWVGVLAFSGSFVRGGIGYMLFPRTMHTWTVVHASTCAAVAATVVTMCAAMAESAPGRKRAAKRPNDGKTVTGRIEMDTRRAA